MILWFQARAFVRSTEDPEKVMEALKNLIPNMDDKERVEVREHRGVYGNLFLSLLYRGKGREAKKTWKHIWENLDPSDREYLKRNIGEFVDELGQLHLRLDKQEAYRGRIKLGGRGVVKFVFKLEAYPARREKFVETARRLVENEVL